MERRLTEIVDVARVPTTGDPLTAVIRVPQEAKPRTMECDVLVVGGGTGGVAAALAAARAGKRVIMTEETDWIGGQATAQGVSALDEHEHIESFGGTASYEAFRNALRAHYRAQAIESARRPHFNPGNCWVTRLAFEPAQAVATLEAMLRPYQDRLTILRRTKPVAASVEADRIAWVDILCLDTNEMTRVKASIVIDATELGDLLPMVDAPYVVGAETIAGTGEPHAQPEMARPRCVQSFTYTFAAERRPEGERHVVPQPESYAQNRARQPYSLTIEVHGGEIYGEESGHLSYRVFETMPGTKGGIWTYRRLIDRTLFGGRYPYDVTMINWPGNDYREASIIDQPAAQVAVALQEAKRVSLGFFHWLQTEAPAEGMRTGAPELRLRPDVMGSTDGLCKFPYIRESRRIHALKTIVEQDVSVAHQAGPRGAHFSDSVGVGWYPIDIHRAGPEDVGTSCRTRPFQISLGALLPARPINLIAAAKNIGTTHITNGCYRLHPVEWNIGEAAGALAAFALDEAVTPQAVWRQAALRNRFQRNLLAAGVPLAWAIDVGTAHPDFAAVQALHMSGRLGADAPLEFHPQAAITPALWLAWGGEGAAPESRAAAARQLFAKHEA